MFDWSLFLGFFIVVISFSLWKSRGGAGAEEDYFLAGRGLPWWLIGISIVAANISRSNLSAWRGRGPDQLVWL